MRSALSFLVAVLPLAALGCDCESDAERPDATVRALEAKHDAAAIAHPMRPTPWWYATATEPRGRTVANVQRLEAELRLLSERSARLAAELDAAERERARLRIERDALRAQVDAVEPRLRDSVAPQAR